MSERKEFARQKTLGHGQQKNINSFIYYYCDLCFNLSHKTDKNDLENQSAN